MWAVNTLRSLIWARTYMRMYTNSAGQTSVCAVWTGHVQIVCGNFVYTNRSLRHAQIACLMTTWLYRNIVKTSAQSDQKMGFRNITPHTRVCKSSFSSIDTYFVQHARPPAIRLSYISSMQRYFSTFFEACILFPNFFYYARTLCAMDVTHLYKISFLLGKCKW